MPQHSSSSLRVFLAEDSAPIRERVTGLLAANAVDVVGEAETPQGCVDGILAVQPDVVVLDIQLEGGSGLEVLRTIRRTDPAIAFVVFSNNAAPAYRRRYLQEGATAFLDKSTEFQQLAGAVRAARSPLSISPAGNAP